MNTKKNLIKRALALFITLSMCLSMLQITAFAVEEIDDSTSDTIHEDEDKATGSDVKDVVETSYGEVEVEVTETENGSRTEWSGEAETEDGKVTVTGSSFVENTTETKDPEEKSGETKIETIETETTEDGEKRVLKDKGEKTDVTVTESIDETFAKEEETVTEIETEQGDWEEVKTVKGESETNTDKPEQTTTSITPEDKDLKVEASVDFNTGANEETDSELGDASKIITDKEKAQILDFDSVIKGYTTKVEGHTYVYENKDDDGNIKSTTTVEKICDDKGNIIGYTVTEVNGDITIVKETTIDVTTEDGGKVCYTKKTATTKTVKGQVGDETETKVDDKTVWTETSDPTIDVSNGETQVETEVKLPTRPEVDTEYTRTEDNMTGKVTKVTDILGDDGKVIGYEITTVSTDENGTTKTQTEQIFGFVTTKTDTTVKTETETKTTKTEQTYDVTAKREDQVTKELETISYTATPDKGNESLTVKVSTNGKVEGQEREAVVESSLSWDRYGNNKVTADQLTRNQVDAKDDVANEIIEAKCFVGATVEVTQEKFDGADYHGTMKVKLNLNESQLDNSDLVLEIKYLDSNGEYKTTNYRVSGWDYPDGALDVNISPEGSTRDVEAVFDGVKSNTFELRLYGTQKIMLDDPNPEGGQEDDKGYKQQSCYAKIDLKTSVKVDITEFKATKEFNKTHSTEEYTNTVDLKAEKVEYAVATTTTTATTETTVTTTEETLKSTWENAYEYAPDDDGDDDDNSGGNGGGGSNDDDGDDDDNNGGNGGGDNTGDNTGDNDGDDDNTDDDVIVDTDDDDDDDDDDDGPAAGPAAGSTTDITDEETPLADIADEVTPLAELPEIEDEAAPLAELAEIEDEETPLAELPELTEIDDSETPLADVPKTGDISTLWYGAALLSACGLAALCAMSRRKEEEEA